MASPQPLSAAFQRPLPLTSREPIKTFYTVLCAVKFLASVPFLYAWFLVPSNRATPKRTVNQELSFSMLRAIFRWCHATRYHLVRSIEPAKAWKDQFVLFDPAPEALYTGYAVDDFIKPEPVPGVWYPTRPSVQDLGTDQRVVIHFHGGAYASGQYEPEATEIPGRMIAKKLSAFVLCAGHRKSAQAGRHFPTQFQDAITTYNYILQLGVKPVNIILSGNSSGGHMALDLLKYAVETPQLGLPKPAAIVLSSPWVDLKSVDVAHILSRSNFKKDFVDMPFISWCRETFIPPNISVEECPYLSLLHHPFSFGGVPAWICAGLDECVYQETAQFVEKSRAVGNTIDFYEAPDAPHDVLWTGPMLGFTTESHLAGDHLQEFVEKHSA